jgi:NAD+ kinase
MKTNLATIIAVYKKSSYEIYSEKGDEEMKAYLEENDTDRQAMIRSHDEQNRSYDAVMAVLKKHKLDFDFVYRGELQQIVDADLVISIGGDGTFLEVSHYLRKGIPVLGVNSDPDKSEGSFLPADRFTFEDYLAKIMNGTLEPKELSRLEIELNGKPIKEPVLNEIMVAHRIPAAGSRYIINVDGKSESQFSSGILVCSSSGQTGSMRSYGGIAMEPGSRLMQYKVIAPFFGKHFNSTKLNGITDQPIEIISKTRQGMFYVDGAHISYDFSIGDKIKAKIGEPLTAYVGDLK